MENKYDKQYMNNTKVFRVIGTKDIDINERSDESKFEVAIKDNVFNLVDLWSDPCITFTQKVDQFDMVVMDAVYTITMSGAKTITLEGIAKVLSGNDKKRPTKKQLDRIRESVEKLRYIHVYIDFSSEMSSRKKCNNPDGITILGYDSCLLPLDKIDAKYSSNGKDLTAYPIRDVSALYRYAEAVGQIIDVPKKLLETQDYFSDTNEAILIKRYVIKRVAQIMNNKNNLGSSKISYLWYESNGEARGLFAELGYKPDNTESWKNTKKKIHKIVKDTLEYLKEIGVIVDFKIYRKGDSNNPADPIMGFKIKYNDTGLITSENK